MMDDKKLDEIFRKIKEQNPPPPGLAQRLIDGLRRERDRAWARPRPVKLVLWAAIAAFLTTLLSVTALAAVLPGFRDWLFGPESGVGNSLQETVAVTEAMGFRVEVLGTVTDQGNVVIYYTLEDAARENRLSMDTAVDSSAQLTNAYGLGMDASGSHFARVRTENVSYDPDAQTLLCRLNLSLSQDWLTENADSLYGYQAGGVTAQVRVSGVRIKNQEEYHILPLSQCALDGETLPIGSVQDNTVFREENGRRTFGPDEFITPEEYVRIYTFWGIYTDEPFTYFRDENGTPSILLPRSDLPWDWLYAVGFLGDKLHVQTAAWLPYQSGETHAGVGWIGCAETGWEQDLIDQHKTQTASSWSSRFLPQSQNAELLLDAGLFRVEDERAVLCTTYNDSEDRMESCFDISPEEAAGYSLVFHYQDTQDVYPELVTEPFQLGDRQPGEAKAFLDLDFDGIAVERMRVSPLGVILVGSKENLGKIDTLELVSGGEASACSRVTNISRSREPDYIVSVRYFVDGAPVDMEGLTAVRINGKEFPLEKE